MEECRSVCNHIVSNLNRQMTPLKSQHPESLLRLKRMHKGRANLQYQKEEGEGKSMQARRRSGKGHFRVRQRITCPCTLEVCDGGKSNAVLGCPVVTSAPTGGI